MCPSHSAHDAYNLERFVIAQDRVYDEVLSEIRAGKKMSHWMWFIFPQIRGLGRSPVSVEYAISSRDEAQAYLQHTVLGPRLKECTRLVLAVEGRSAVEIFGSPDDMKFRSCMTLFEDVAPHEIFQLALQKYFGGEPDRLTLERL
jgi:uncharacterized protein (DUF1810 family)